MNYQEAASYWEKKDTQTARMDENALFSEMEKFIKAHITCALATGSGSFVRCTPIEYSYKGRKFWILSEGGLKFQALKENKNVCLAIYDSYTGFDQLSGMQVTGTAELIEPWSGEYMDLLAFKKTSAENLKKLPHTIYLIKVTPIHIDFLWLGFKKLGFNSRQHLTFNQPPASLKPE